MREDSYLMYPSMLGILKNSSDVKIKLFASLLERNATGKEFAMNSALKEVIAAECNCSPRSLDSAFSFLVKENIIVRIKPHLYIVNPRHAFKGSSSTRNQNLKAVIELVCEDC